MTPSIVISRPFRNGNDWNPAFLQKGAATHTINKVALALTAMVEDFWLSRLIQFSLSAPAAQVFLIMHVMCLGNRAHSSPSEEEEERENELKQDKGERSKKPRTRDSGKEEKREGLIMSSRVGENNLECTVLTKHRQHVHGQVL